MVVYVNHVDLNKTTSSNGSEVVADRTNLQPIKWFTITVDEECYIGINGDATADSIHLFSNEAYTTPDRTRVIKLTVMRAGDLNVNVRGSAWV